MVDQDYRDLKDILSKIKGKFLLSINDDPFIRSLFQDFIIEEVQTRYSVMAKGNQKMSELLIRNY
jgi:DNA adenine methylase